MYGMGGMRQARDLWVAEVQRQVGQPAAAAVVDILVEPVDHGPLVVVVPRTRMHLKFLQLPIRKASDQEMAQFQ
jgi:hypothetical protein